MKKTAILTGLLVAIQGAQLSAMSFFKSSSSEGSSSAVAADSSEGGTITVNDKTYKVEPGQEFQYSGGGVSTHMSTVQEGDKEPVTTVIVEASEPVATVDGKSAAPVQSAAKSEADAEEEEEEEEMDTDLEMDDSYED